jgi:hypothetical protein
MGITGDFTVTRTEDVNSGSCRIRHGRTVSPAVLEDVVPMPDGVTFEQNRCVNCGFNAGPSSAKAFKR